MKTVKVEEKLLDKPEEKIEKKYNFDPQFQQTEDYKSLVIILKTLQEQRQQALNDLKLLEDEKTKALQDPVAFVESIVNKTCKKMPTKSEVAEVPKIDIAKYDKLLVKVSKKRRREEDDTPAEGDIVRGRLYTNRKPASFNKLWSPQEQKKLEKLLDEYPDETVASHRWEKIARALGNRSPKQVASRVQKYFIKLAKAGLPVPGKLPNLEFYTKKKKKINLTINPDQTEIVGPAVEPTTVASSCIYDVLHYGIKCDKCGMAPIIGPRWKCTVCPANSQVDLCQTCNSDGYDNDIHKQDHIMQKIAEPEASSANNDWSNNEMSYLDPKYMPN